MWIVTGLVAACLGSIIKKSSFVLFPLKPHTLCVSNFIKFVRNKITGFGRKSDSAYNHLYVLLIHVLDVDSFCLCILMVTGPPLGKA